MLTVDYLAHTTLKGLIGIAPSGAIIFLSQLYTGSISDGEIVERSGILDLPFSEGDDIMADKGFAIEDLLPLGVPLNIGYRYRYRYRFIKNSYSSL